MQSPAGVGGIAALAEPTRWALYAYVAAQPDPVGREQAAEAVGIPVHSVKFHLERLVREGLLEVEFRRLSGRSGPGAGRPAKLYQRSTAELSVSLPERRYDLAAQLLAAAVERSSRDNVPVRTAVHEVALESGRELGTQVSGDQDGRERAREALASQGYEPRLSSSELVLANCPFDALAREHTELVCGMNQVYVTGVLEGLGCAGLEACLDPEPGSCCVRVRERGRSSDER